MFPWQEDRRIAVEIFDNPCHLTATGITQRPHGLSRPSLGEERLPKVAFASQNSLQRFDECEVSDDGKQDVHRRATTLADGEAAITIEVSSYEVSLQTFRQVGKSDRVGFARYDAVLRQVHSHLPRTDRKLGVRHLRVCPFSHRMIAFKGGGKACQMFLVSQGKRENNITLVANATICGKEAEPVRLRLTGDRCKKSMIAGVASLCDIRCASGDTTSLQQTTDCDARNVERNCERNAGFATLIAFTNLLNLRGREPLHASIIKEPITSVKANKNDRQQVVISVLWLLGGELARRLCQARGIVRASFSVARATRIVLSMQRFYHIS